MRDGGYRGLGGEGRTAEKTGGGGAVFVLTPWRIGAPVSVTYHISPLPRSPPRKHLATNHKQTTAAALRTSNDIRRRCFHPSDDWETATASWCGFQNKSVRPQRMSRKVRRQKQNTIRQKWFSSVKCSNTASTLIFCWPWWSDTRLLYVAESVAQIIERRMRSCKTPRNEQRGRDSDPGSQKHGGEMRQIYSNISLITSLYLVRCYQYQRKRENDGHAPTVCLRDHFNS
jgi:hypothetical protein